MDEIKEDGCLMIIALVIICFTIIEIISVILK